MITPEQLARAGTEDSHQSALFLWANQTGDPRLKLMFAIPNGGFRDIRTASKLKATGVKPGVPDIFLPIGQTYWKEPDRLEFRYLGLFIELKIDTGKVSVEQSKWIFDLTSQGYRVVVAWGWQQAVDVIKDYLGMK